MAGAAIGIVARAAPLLISTGTAIGKSLGSFKGQTLINAGRAAGAAVGIYSLYKLVKPKRKLRKRRTVKKTKYGKRKVKK